MSAPYSAAVYHYRFSGYKSLGENDAWLVATAESLNADIVGADRAAFERLGARYLRFR